MNDVADWLTKETEGYPDNDEREAARKREVKVKGEGEGEEAMPVEDLKRGQVATYEGYLEWKKRQEEEERHRDPERITDPLAFEAKMFRKRWNDKRYGSFDQNTKIPCKRFTHNPAPLGSTLGDTIEVFSVKIREISGGLQWPLEVFGMVALRDSLDHSRNVIFKRDRDNCQILTDQNPYLVLTGPVRAVMLWGLVIFEASLYVKGATRSDDKELSLLATSLEPSPTWASCLFMRSCTSRLSTLELTLGHILYSVEATIEVRVINGPWPDGFCAQFAACPGSIGPYIVLLDSGDEKMPITGDEIQLARQVVSVEIDGELIVVASSTNGYVSYTDKMAFKAQKMGTTSKELCIGDCMLQVTVYWSLLTF